MDRPIPTGVVSQNSDAQEAQIEARELHKYLMAKTYFDCREYDRCCAVFLPTLIPKGEVARTSHGTAATSKDQALGDTEATKTSTKSEKEFEVTTGFPDLSRKALFLSLYAKYMAGEKRKDERSETILGPADGTITNAELNDLGRILETRLALQEERNEEPQGWLEYLYGVVLAKGKTRDVAKSWLIKSVRAYPFNWGAWQELNDLIETIEQVSHAKYDL